MYLCTQVQCYPLELTDAYMGIGYMSTGAGIILRAFR